MNQLAQKHAAEFIVTVLNGPEKGAVYKLVSGSVRIGRGEDNDICLKSDPKISRYHATLTSSPLGIEVRDISDRNKVLVNDQKVDKAVLTPLSVIQLGDTQLEFNLTTADQLAKIGPRGLAPAGIDLRDRFAGLSKKRSSKRSGPATKLDPGKVRFYAVLGILGLVILFLMNSNPESPDKKLGLRSPDAVQNQIEENKKLVEELKERGKKTETTNYRQAQASFIKGFRDFQKGQYERARDHFQACLALYPEHPQCGSYYRDANKKLSELIQYYLSLGYDYQTKNQFSACMAAFKNVKYLQKDETSLIFREAQAGYKVCEAQEEAGRL